MTDRRDGKTRSSISGGAQQGPVLQGRDFHNVQIVTNQAAAAPVALAQLPPLEAGFTGRDREVGEITSLLSAAGDAEAVVVSAVAGLAGVGKTALAVQACHTMRRAGWFPGGVLFIDLHGYDVAPVKPEQALDALLRALGVPGQHIPPSTEERAGLYRSTLASISDPVLIIADNASSEAQVRPLLPGPGPHRVIVTSRHTLARLGARLLDVEVLDVDAGVTLLDATLRIGRSEDNRLRSASAAARRLAEACGGLPLALRIVAALLAAEPALTTEELADELADEMHRLEALRYDDGGGTSAPSVAAAFELSYRQLEEVAAQLFRLLPVNPGPDLSTTAAAALAGSPERETRKVLGQLAKAHLIDVAAGATRRWRMHDLLRLYAQQLCDEHVNIDERDRAQNRLLDYYLETTKAADQHVRALTGTKAPEAFTSRTDALAWLDSERPTLVAVVTMAAEVGRGDVASRLPIYLAEYFDWRGRSADKLATSAVGLEAARRLGDQDRESELLSCHGIALWQMGRVEESIAAHQAVAAADREAGNRHNEGMSQGNLGTALAEAGRFEEAISAYENAVAIFRETNDKPRESMSLTGLGNQLSKMGRVEESIAAHQAAAAIAQKSGYLYGESMALNNLGSALDEAGRFEEAITAFQNAVPIYREAGHRYSEGRALNNLGNVLTRAGRIEEAITTYQDAAAIYREIGDRLKEGSSLNNLGNVLRRVRQFEKAITAHQVAITIFREIGDQHNESEALNNLELDRTAQQP